MPSLSRMSNPKQEHRFEGVVKSATFSRIVERFNLRNKKVLDLGCGYGQHLVVFGKGSVGVTSTKEEVESAKLRKLDIRYGNVEELAKIGLDQNFDAIWANNLFEHLRSAHAFLMKLKAFANEDTTLILGVPVIPFPYFLTRLPKFRGALASNHTNFFTWRTLALTLKFAGWEVVEIRPFKFENKILDKFFRIFAPQAYAVAKNNTDFKYAPKKINEWQNEELYADLLEITHQR
jgi:SAM-dependent methyltransferase